MLPAFASVADLAARVPGGISDDDAPRAQAAIDDASTKVRAEAGKTWVIDDLLDLPSGDDAWRADVLVGVTLAAAVRAFVNPAGVQSDALGSYSETLANSSTDVYLTAQERSQVRRAAGTSQGLWALSTTRSDVRDGVPGGLETERFDLRSAPQPAQLVDVEGSTEPVPWFDVDGF